MKRQDIFQKWAKAVRSVRGFFLNPRLLLCLGIGWMITNGWCYLFLFFGLRFGRAWMIAVGGAYAAFLWFPFTPEKIATVAIAILLLRLLFPQDQATLAVLREEGRRAREAFLRLTAKQRAKRVARGMRRVLVIGCPGSGKSSFARALRDCTGLPLVHLDMLYWRADRTTLSQEAFDRALQAAIQGEAWIIDGHYQRTLGARLAAADTVFFLDYPTRVCLDGIRTRQGQARSDMPWQGAEDEAEFLSFVERFRGSTRKKTLRLLSQHKSVRCVTFRTRAAGKRFLEALADCQRDSPSKR